MSETTKLARRLVLEVELPEMNVDDLPEIIRDHGSSETSVSDEILNCIGDVSSGLLIVEVSGEKGDGDIVTVPALIRSARIEDEPPAPRRQWGENLERLAEKIDPDDEGKLPNLWLGAGD